MAMQPGALRTALIEAGASDEKADEAADDMAGYEGRFAHADVPMEALAGDLRLVQWMAVAGVGLILLVLGNVIALWIGIGDMSGQLARIIHTVSN